VRPPPSPPAPAALRALEGVLHFRRERRRLIQLHGPPGSGKSELLLQLARVPEQHLLAVDMLLPLVPDLRAVMYGQLDPSGQARGSLSRGGPGLEFFLQNLAPTVLIDHADACREEVEQVVPALLGAAPGTTFIVGCREPFPWPQAASVALEPMPFSGVPHDDEAGTALLLAPCDGERRSAERARPDALRRLGLRLGGLPLQLRLAAPAVAREGAEAALERLPACETLEPLLELAWSCLPGPLRLSVCLAAVFSGGFDRALFEAAGGDPAALPLLAERGWLSGVLAPGNLRWRLLPAALDWLADKNEFIQSAPGHCELHAAAVAERARRLRGGGGASVQSYLDQKNQWIAALRLGQSPLMDPANASVLAWLLDGVLFSHSVAALSPGHLAELDAHLHRLGQHSHHATVQPMLPLLQFDRAFVEDVRGHDEQALAQYQRLRGPGSLGWLAGFRVAEVLGRRLDVRGASEAIGLALEQGAPTPALERESLQLAALLHQQIGNSEGAIAVLRRLVEHAERERAEATELAWLAAQLALLEGDDEAMRRHEAALVALKFAGINQGLAHAFLAQTALMRRDAGAALAHARQAQTELRAPSLVQSLLLAICIEGLAQLLLGDLASSRARLEALLPLLAQSHVLFRSLLLGALALVEAHSGRDDRARERLAELQEIAGALDASRQIAELLREAAALVQGSEVPLQVRPIAPGGPQVQLARLVHAWQLDDAARRSRTAQVARDGSWLRAPGGALVSFVSRPVLSALLAALCEACATRPGVALSKEALVQRAWPAERRANGPAATNRLHVALATLRKHGLADALRSTREGWLLAPELTRVVRDQPSAPP
jgi:hypothetical protein